MKVEVAKQQIGQTLSCLLNLLRMEVISERQYNTISTNYLKGMGVTRDQMWNLETPK